MPRIVVSVDMISTGTDIKPLEVLLFMRDVKSSVYFDQMKGRGTRTVDPTTLQSVTGDAKRKTHFVLVDAVGVTENEKTDSKPLDRKPSVSFDRLMRGIALGSSRDEDSMQSMADRLSRLDRTLYPDDREEIEDALQESAEEMSHEATSIQTLVNTLLDAADPDKQVERAKEKFDTDDPSPEQIDEATDELIEEASRPFDDPGVRETITEVRQRSYITLDETSADEVIEVGPASNREERAKEQVQTFQEFIEENRDEITALQIFYEQPYGERHLTLEHIRELAKAIESPPVHLTPEELWDAYAQLETDKVKGAREDVLLTDIITLVRHAMGEDEDLHHFREDVEERFYEWLSQQDCQQRFSSEQLEWLEMIKDYLAANLTIDLKDFQHEPFHKKGGPVKAIQLFGKDQLKDILDELNETIVA